jgi:septum formation inhibitor-activating ATPase MinD
MPPSPANDGSSSAKEAGLPVQPTNRSMLPAMKKSSPPKDTLRREYKATDFPAGLVRGKYASKTAALSNIVVLEPELATVFPDSATVNDTLRAILKIAKHVGTHQPL